MSRIVPNSADDHVTVCGSVPVKLKAYEGSDLAEASKLEFKISDRISASEKLLVRSRVLTR